MDARTPVARPAPAEPLALYVHIPFCETKCPYCDFNTYEGIAALIPDYIPALERELRAWGALLANPPVATVFFGGGTPSFLPAADLTGLTTTIRGDFAVADDAEITVECNPGDIDTPKLAAYREAGVNRLSIGVQSLDDSLLKLLGRRHDAAMAVESAQRAQAAGFSNLSVDLMFGLPGQTLGQWRDTLDRAIELDTPHVSLYALTLEPNTPLEASVHRGETPEPDPDLAADMYVFACERLEAIGYGHYEISNWAKPGFEARHNLAYWLSAQYLGVGPGAHSYLRLPSGPMRFENLKSPRGYIRVCQEPPPISSESDPVTYMCEHGPVLAPEQPGPTQEISDYLMMGLRLSRGVSLSEFRARFDAGLFDLKGPELRDLIASGLIEPDEDAVRIPHDRWLVGNEVFMRLVDAPAGLPA